MCIDFVTKILTKTFNINEIQSDVRTFVYSILNAFVEEMTTVEKLYGDDMHTLVNDIETVLMENFMQNAVDEDYELSIRFCIGGAFRLLALEKDLTRIQKTIELIERVLNFQQ